MKKVLAIILVLMMCTGCAPKQAVVDEIPFESRFDKEVLIKVSDDGIWADKEAVAETGDVFISHDIIYYEDKDAYESGLPYGEGEESDKHTAEEAAKHTVLNITKPGAYRVSGNLSAGQIRVDLGEDAAENPDAVVELILDGADITCTVAPAILFLNVYECDNGWTVENAKPDVDTTKAGAVLVMAENSKNNISGSHVSKIFKDQEEEKKLWKQDGAIYSYMSMNVFGPGKLNLTADNEGLDTELHLTINGGEINIFSGNDGINTNEDGVSVTTINGGDIHIVAGLGAEGDGIDSNGYLVINGGSVISAANPAADAGLDSDLGSYVHGGTVIALGSAMDWAESDSEQVTMNLQFAGRQNGDEEIVIKDADGNAVFSFKPAEDEILKDYIRAYSGAIISTSTLTVGEEYTLYIGGVQQGYTGSDMPRRHGFGGEPPEFDGKMPPEFDGEMPPEFKGEMPPQWNGEGEPPERGENGERPAFDGERPPRGEDFNGSMIPFNPEDAEQKDIFHMADKVNMFTGVSALVKPGE